MATYQSSKAFFARDLCVWTVHGFIGRVARRSKEKEALRKKY
jgi:hypothetical protein